MDIDFLERCIGEFHLLDPKGVTFRYPENEIIAHAVSFARLKLNMEHVHDILEGMISSLGLTYDQNDEWKAILGSF